MRYITEKEVNEFLPMKDAISIMEEAFFDYANHHSSYLPRRRLKLENGALVVMPGYFHKYNMVGLKTYVGSQKNHRHVLIFNASTGEPVATIESSRMGQIKTGALPAMVSKKLLNSRNQSVCIIGSGFQASGQIEGLASAFNLDKVSVFSRTYSNALKFAEETSKNLGVDVKAYDNVRSALKNSTIISCATNSTESLFNRSDLSDSYHVNLVGANIPARREVSTDVLSQSQLVVVEDMDQARMESSEIMDLEKSGSKTKCIELKDLFLSPPENEVRRSVFKSMGVGLEDVAVSCALLKNMGEF